jgi:hypothetical protein
MLIRVNIIHSFYYSSYHYTDMVHFGHRQIV